MGQWQRHRPDMPWLPRLVPALMLVVALSAAETDTTHDDPDVVELANGRSLSGRIIGRSGDASIVIDTASGRIGLDEEQILRVVPGFATRLRELDSNDYRGHLDLARWARLNKRSTQALELLSPFLDSSQLDAEGMGLLARLTDEVVQPPQDGAARALPLYQRYAAMGGQDQELLERLRVLRAVQDDYDRRLSDAEARRAQVTVVEGLEAEDGWRPEQIEYANPLTVEALVLPNTGKNRGLRFSYQGGDKYKAVARRSSAVALDIRSTPLLGVWIWNPTKAALGVSIAVKTGEHWDYYESVARSVPAGDSWHRLTFDLLETSFKCKKDDYAKYGFPVENPDSIREIQLQLHNGKANGEVLVDGVAFAARP